MESARKPSEKAWPIVCRALAAETAPSGGTAVMMATWSAAAAVTVLVRVPA
jgi:hypothetical protein